MDIPQCTDCGACCRVFGIVEVTGDDLLEHGTPQGVTTFNELGYRRMLTDGFKCCCLLDSNWCYIYDLRPSVCRRFPRGGDLCHMAIEQQRRLQGEVP